jgi:K+-sensing histidine kinase KdpD
VTTIYAGAKVLSRSEGRLSEADRRGIFEDIHAEAERLHRLVEDVVALTRFGEGALDIGSEPVLLQRVVPAVVGSEQSRWPEGRFEVDLSPACRRSPGDPTYVEQVIRNLLANAVKYGGSEAAIQLIVRAEDDEVRVRVLDNGPGFPEDEASRLFELYYRSPSTARQASGSGIGLFVCARLLNAMGGRIWAGNRPEGGAEFGFALRHDRGPLGRRRRPRVGRRPQSHPRSRGGRASHTSSLPRRRARSATGLEESGAGSSCPSPGQDDRRQEHRVAIVSRFTSVVGPPAALPAELDRPTSSS